MTPCVVRIVVIVGLVTGGVACGTSEEVEVPIAEELAERLIDVDTFDGDWSVNVPPDSSDAAISGVVTAEMQGLVPSIDLCDKASEASRTAADEIAWMAFRQMDLDVEDPIDPPDRTGNMVFALEFLTADEPEEIEDLFDLLRSGMEACLGDIPAGEEGPGTSEVLALPDVGDERWGMVTVLEEAGGWAEWRIHSGLVHDGPVLALITVVDIRADTEPYYTYDDVGDMIATAAGLLEQGS